MLCEISCAGSDWVYPDQIDICFQHVDLAFLKHKVSFQPSTCPFPPNAPAAPTPSSTSLNPFLPIMCCLKLHKNILFAFLHRSNEHTRPTTQFCRDGNCPGSLHASRWRHVHLLHLTVLLRFAHIQTIHSDHYMSCVYLNRHRNFFVFAIEAWVLQVEHTSQT